MVGKPPARPGFSSGILFLYLAFIQLLICHLSDENYTVKPRKDIEGSTIDIDSSLSRTRYGIFGG
jgi:hypothetical protein